MKAEFKNTKKEFEPIEVTITLESLNEVLTLIAQTNCSEDYIRESLKSITELKNTSINSEGLTFWRKIGLPLVEQISNRK